jgi:hypothetical protein
VTIVPPKPLYRTNSESDTRGQPREPTPVERKSPESHTLPRQPPAEEDWQLALVFARSRTPGVAETDGRRKRNLLLELGPGDLKEQIRNYQKAGTEREVKGKRN